MAALTNNDFRQIGEWARSQPDIKADLKTWTITRAQMQAALQAIEDYMVAAFSARPATSLKAAIEAQTGATTNARALALWRAWSEWRGGR